MGKRKKEKRSNDNIPDVFWCLVCGCLEEKSSTSRVRLVNLEALGPLRVYRYRVGATTLNNPRLPPAAHRPMNVVDAVGNSLAKNGHNYVGYVYNGSFQLRQRAGLLD